jgi:succinate dehydrogenase/fumarate reductase flavoprotein subunit
VADFLEFGELMVTDALARQESCGGHFNEAFQTEENEALRDDENFCHVAAWEHTGEGPRNRNSQGAPGALRTSNYAKELQVSSKTSIYT